MKHETFGDSFHYFVYSLYKGTKDASKATLLEKGVLPHSVDMEHENMDSEDYLLKSGLSDDDAGVS